MAFHPGYYIKEIVDESGLTQEDFAKRLATTPKNLSLLIRAEQSLSIDIAMKLARMIGTSVNYWLNIQNAYDTFVAELKSQEELEEERKVFQHLNYSYFRKNYGLLDLAREKDTQIKVVREFLKVSTLTVFKNRDMAVSFRRNTKELTEANTVKANIMVQIATNKALTIKAPKYNRIKFKDKVQYALTLTNDHSDFWPMIYEAFKEAGVIFVILPNLAGSKVNGATKKVGDHILLMLNDNQLYADIFWYTLLHEIGHIMSGDYGISFDKDASDREISASIYAEDSLVPRAEYDKFVLQKCFDLKSIKKFAHSIDRDPGIVLGRLQNDRLVRFEDWTMKEIKPRYRIKSSHNQMSN